MKVQFDGNGFSAEMGDVGRVPQTPKLPEGLSKKSMGLILGIVALVVALATLLMGFIASSGADLWQSAFGAAPVRYVLLMSVICFVLGAVSVACGVTSIVFYAKSAKDTPALIGLILSIIAFVVCFAALIFPLIAVALT